ncbi:unnamed protein product [Blepharisma stoltei]|uniref:Uncharacterized protein n=1 Tax=Blepharisma stoltei TaxID=1481888 RepID=A0AAU9JIX0_9CILI|nr:unnamed protein product [Blepharisma stoltei]
MTRSLRHWHWVVNWLWWFAGTAAHLNYLLLNKDISVELINLLLMIQNMDSAKTMESFIIKNNNFYLLNLKI